MNWNYFLKDNKLKFPKDSHSIFPASSYHWLNYSLDKMIAVYQKKTAQELGTKLHSLAAMLIENKQPLPNVQKTLNMYVNDAILYSMVPEKQLYYSEEFRGTADAVTVDNGILRIHDLKTGTTKASIHQLEIYAALFCLDCGCTPGDFDKIELRIYQNNEIIVGTPDVDVIVPIIDKIITVDKLIRDLEVANRGQ